MRFAGPHCFGRFATRMAALCMPPYYGRIPLSRLNANGYVSPTAQICHSLLQTGKNIFLDDNVLIYQDADGGPVELGEAVHLYRDNILQTGQGGSISIGARTHIQPRCQLSAYAAALVIGRRVEIAPFCAFYPYDHGMVAGRPIRRQPLRSKGGIVIEDDVWLSTGVTVLDGVTIGQGAVVGAGAVVTRDLPAGSVCAGVPARVIKMRSALDDLAEQKVAGN